jgi:hypothetical protein
MQVISRDEIKIIIRLLRSILWNQIHPGEHYIDTARPAQEKLLIEAQRLVD